MRPRPNEMQVKGVQSRRAKCTSLMDLGNLNSVMTVTGTNSVLVTHYDQVG
jgi:hypothetical protein